MDVTVASAYHLMNAGANGQVGIGYRSMPIAILAGIGLDRIWRHQVAPHLKTAGCGELSPRGKMKLFRLGHLELVAALGMYFASGPALILLNKHIMIKMDFRFPIAISTLGNVGMSLMAHVAVQSGLCQLRSPRIQRAAFLQVLLPLSAFSSLSLVLGNCAYLYISVPLIQILKSGTIVLVMCMGFLMGVERFNWQVVVSVATIALGIAVSVGYDAAQSQSAQTSALLVGVVLMLTANSAEAGKAIFMQVSVQRLAVLDSLYWVSPLVAGMGFALTCMFEWDGVAATQVSSPLVSAMVGSCILGAFVNLSTMWVTKLVGGLSMKVLVSARNIGLVLFSAAALDEPCSAMQYIGYSAALLGMALYDRARQSQTFVAPAASAASAKHGAAVGAGNAAQAVASNGAGRTSAATAAAILLAAAGSGGSEQQCVRRSLLKGSTPDSCRSPTGGFKEALEKPPPIFLADN